MMSKISQRQIIHNAFSLLFSGSLLL
uniref:Uncharacterized protein n=1 Tax=Arundo donax TaxID=35708 RepID=A0A0A9CAB2_ARUDO